MKIDIIKTVDEYFNEYIEVEGDNIMKGIPQQSQELVGLAINKVFQDLLNDGFVLLRKQIVFDDGSEVVEPELISPPTPQPQQEQEQKVDKGFLGKLRGRT